MNDKKDFQPLNRFLNGDRLSGLCQCGEFSDVLTRIPRVIPILVVTFVVFLSVFPVDVSSQAPDECPGCGPCRPDPDSPIGGSQICLFDPYCYTPEVIWCDTIAPVITLNGANPKTIEAGTPYVELGATATDNVDGDLTASIVIDASGVNPSIPGTYQVTYDVSDSSGNAATQVIRTINVVVIEETTGLYVWRDPAPAYNGTPIDPDAPNKEALRLASFANAEGISTIYYDNWGCGVDPSDCPLEPGAEHQEDATLAEIIRLLHSHNLRVEALYTKLEGPDQRRHIKDVVTHNQAYEADPDAQFDAIRLNIEVFPSGESEPSTPGDLELYATAVTEAEGLPVYVSISHHWDSPITYNGETKPKEAYKHILDIVAGVDVQTVQDNSGTGSDARAIERVTKEEVCYANCIGKPVHITIETYDVVSNIEDGKPHQTFFEEGEAEMKSALADIDYTAPGVDTPCAEPIPNYGLAYHFYRQSYGSPDITGWISVDKDFDGIFNEVDTEPLVFSDEFSDGTTTGAITRADRDWVIKDEPDDPGTAINEGVRIIVGLGSQTAQVEGTVDPPGACDPTTTPPTIMEILPDKEANFVFSCGSSTVQVTAGTVKATATGDGRTVSVVVGAGGGVTFSLTQVGKLQMTNIGTTSLSANADGREVTLAPGEVIVLNVAPEVGVITFKINDTMIDAPVIEKESSIEASADFSDPGTVDTHTAVWDWGDGSEPTIIEITDGSRTANAAHTYTAPGVYTVRLTVTDDDGGSGESVFQFVVAFDPEGGFVTGGGWIDSPHGAYVADPSLTGKAIFGFVSKYKKGANVPTGETEFQFKVADLNFHSDTYDWLVVAGHKAQFKGTGKINGTGNYGFMLTAIDEALAPSTDSDLFRIKIWDKDTYDTIVYDNQMDAGEDVDPTTEIRGGNIVIHKAKYVRWPSCSNCGADRTIGPPCFVRPAWALTRG